MLVIRVPSNELLQVHYTMLYIKPGDVKQGQTLDAKVEARTLMPKPERQSRGQIQKGQREQYISQWKYTL